MKLKAFYLILFWILSANLFAQKGLLDSTFNSMGPIKGKDILPKIKTGGRALTYDSKNRILVVSSPYEATDTVYVSRIKEDGTNDLFYNGTPTAKICFGSTSLMVVSSIATQTDGKIIVGGFQMDVAGQRKMMVARIHENGKIDTTFGNKGQWVSKFPNNEQVDRLGIQSNGHIILAGNNNNKLTVVSLNPNGTLDTNFNKTGNFISNGVYPEFVSGLEIHNDSIIVSGNYQDGSYVYYYVLYKLTPSGSIDQTFGKLGTGRLDLLTPYSYQDFSADLYAYPNGQLLVAGYTYSEFKVVKLNKTGSLDTTFGNLGVASLNKFAGTYPTCTGLDIDKNGNIILSGSGMGNCLIGRVSSAGIPDTIFGSNGRLDVTIPGSTAYGLRGILSRDQNLFVTSDDSLTYVAKVSLRPSMRILGEEFVLPGHGDSYTIQVPNNWSYTYIWGYTGTGAYFVPNNNGTTVNLFFTENATSGLLRCGAFNSKSFVAYAVLKITINNQPTDATQLAKLKCATVVTDCYNNFINYFHFGSIFNDSSGCNPGGYSDFTQSGIADTLAIGGVYSAVLQLQNDGVTANSAIYIDYNNDGRFDDVDEFVTSITSDKSVVEINNIVLKNKVGYDGPKRLRVRSRIDNELTANDGCAISGEKGETEDYLIILSTQENLDAPEIITPNADGFNDYFVVRGVTPDKGNKLSIFDRWGDTKFTQSDYENNWGGTDEHGAKLLPGTYYYVFFNNGKTIRGFLEIRY